MAKKKQPIKSIEPPIEPPIEEGSMMGMGPEGVDVTNEMAPGMAPEDMRSDLERGFEGVQNQERSLNSKKLMNQNRLMEVKADLIRAMFRILQEAGVDPNNLQSIRDFLQKLEEQDPDLAEMFQIAFNGLANDQGVAGAVVGPIGQMPEGMAPQENPEAMPGLMGKYKNLAEGTFRPQ
jgi:hypothetical protein